MRNLTRYTDLQWQWAAQRYRDGYSIFELAEFLDLSEKTVRVNLRRRGVKFRHGLQPLEMRRIAFERLGEKKWLGEKKCY